MMDFAQVAAVLDVLTKLPGTSNQYPYIGAACHAELRRLNNELTKPAVPDEPTVADEPETPTLERKI